MQKYQNVSQDTIGNIIQAATISVWTDSSHTIAATIYSDNGTTLLPSNTVTTDTLGNFFFYAANGRYYLKQTKTGITTVTYDDVLLFDPADSSASSNIGFVQSGTGAPTDVQTALRNIETNAKTGFCAADGITDDTAAMALVVANGKHIHLPAGTYLIDTLALTASGHTIEGDGPGVTILKARTSSTTKLLNIDGGASFITNITAKNLTLDMSNMTDASTSYGLYQAACYDCHFEQVTVINNGTSKISHYCESKVANRGVYTSTYLNCDFGSTTGKIKHVGNSLSDAITTLTYIGCAFGSVNSNNALSITFNCPTIQGTLTKVTLANIDGFRIKNGDIEGASGTYLSIGSNVNHLVSEDNEFSGFSGTYSSGTATTSKLDEFGGGTNGFAYTATTAGTIVWKLTDFLVSFVKTAASIFRITIQNSNATAQQVDIEYKNNGGSVYFGQLSTGEAFIDARSTSTDILLKPNGNTRFQLKASGAIRGLTTTNGPVGTATLAANAASTNVSNSSVTASSLIWLFPTSANAAADIAAGNVYISALSAGSTFTITHPNNANADKTFNYLILN